MRILVIDDDELAGEMTAAIAAELGHDVVLASSAADGLDVLEREVGVDVIVCDLHMPRLDGMGLLRQLRRAQRNWPFILLSGDEPGAAMAGEPGLDFCLVKDALLEQSLGEALAAIQLKQAS